MGRTSSSLVLIQLLAVVTGFTTLKVGVFMEKTIDPIVKFGTYNISHLHQFAGSTGVTAHTKTSTELRKYCTTAENPCDFSAYWWPALINKHTKKVYKPYLASMYYHDLDTAEMPLPENLKLVAGNAHNQDLSQVDLWDAAPEWFCDGESNGVNVKPGFPDHACKTKLHFLLHFPDCLDPHDITRYAYAPNSTANHAKKCPDGMKQIPQLRFSIRYDLPHIVPSRDLILSCGGPGCSHGDFFNGWTTGAAKAMMKATGSIHAKAKKYTTCTLPKTPCAGHDLEPHLGSSTYDGPPPGVKVLASPALAARALNSTEEQE